MKLEAEKELTMMTWKHEREIKEGALKYERELKNEALKQKREFKIEALKLKEVELKQKNVALKIAATASQSLWSIVSVTGLLAN